MAIVAEHSANFERYKKYYDNGYWSETMLRNVVKKGVLTKTEFKEITGEKY